MVVADLRLNSEVVGSVSPHRGRRNTDCVVDGYLKSVMVFFSSPVSFIILDVTVVSKY